MKRSPLRKVSKKRSSDLVKYNKAKKEYLDSHERCEICECFKARVIHHKKGRLGPLLWDQRYFMALCEPCHDTVETKKEWAMKMGYRLDRLGK